ncbi:protein of unknown function [Lysobacter sp. yr284]|uniref:Arm DNA-binding domain-containing protein n=1 Tax=Lysobacter sp. yr284 TaxID=1761791 RepID=UPI0008978B1F|nr:protein of unknown function [Lysobacter sp. yr284]
MPLTDVAIRKAKPAHKPLKLSDGACLYLPLMPSGARYWRWKYRWLGKEKLLSLGVHPETGLADARSKRDDARRIHASGRDPAEDRKASQAAREMASATSFEAIDNE